MKAIITQSNPRNNKIGNSIVYVESQLDAVVDAWYNKHEVYNLSFKCKTWGKVKTLATKEHTKALKELFPDAHSIKFSSKAGCRCGCSPGYIIKHEPNTYGRNFWVDMLVTPEETEELSQRVNSGGIEAQLKAEIAREVPLSVS
jgi:hypothetical protein